MQLRHWKSATQPNDGMFKVTAMCWSPDGKKLAVSTVDRVVTLYDEDGVKRDKFSTKPSVDKGPKTYVVKDMSFSPQSDRIAIAQSDNIVFVYKIGNEWGDKKSISNKFQHSCPINALIWPIQRPNEVIYGLAEGKIKSGQMKAQKPTTLYSCDSYVTALASNRQGNAIVSAHLDGSIFIFSFENIDRGAQLIARHSVSPYALAWGTSIGVAGNDNQIIFYSDDGNIETSYDLSDRSDIHEFTCAITNPTGDNFLFGNFNTLHLYGKNNQTMSWEEMTVSKIENMYSTTAMSWKPDGGKVAVGTLCGIVDIYDISMKRTLYKKKYEITHVSASQITVKNIHTNTIVSVKSKANYEIIKTTVHLDRYILCVTSDSLVFMDINTQKTSEIKWNYHNTEKFIFDNESVCVIYISGEVSIIEYGQDDLLAYFRTSYVNRHVFNIRIVEEVSSKNNNIDNKMMKSSTTSTTSTTTTMMRRKGDINATNNTKKVVAYLIDLQIICVKDLTISGNNIMINHDVKIDWLMLNEKASLLLYRDRSQGLHLYRLQSQIRTQLITLCTYVQWVPLSDVIVAQQQSQLCVWYNINAPDQITMKTIKGEVIEIERAEGQTNVIVDEGTSQAVYPLDEALISFSAALEDNDLNKAMMILDPLDVSQDVEDMWRQLYHLAIESDDIRIAIRASTAIKDTATANYLIKLNETMNQVLSNSASTTNMRDHYLFRAKMALLRKDLPAAELEYLNAGKISECIDMYNNLMKYDQAIRIAEQTRHPNEEEMKRQYYDYLLETKQYDVAASYKDKNNDYIAAIELYLKGNMPTKAAQIVFNRKIYQPSSLLDSILSSLIRHNIHDVVGEFYEYMDDFPHAIDYYEKGHAYKKAVELARKYNPARVVELQEKWGDYLVSQRQIDMAINHYIESKAYQKGIEAALNIRQYTRALQLVKVVDDETLTRPYYITLGRYYEESEQYNIAEKCYLASNDYKLAVNMHAKLGNWEVANKLASAYMSPQEIGLMYINFAQEMQAQNRFKEAERLYITVKEYDLAIGMYKKYKRYDDMIRLVKDYQPELLKETHQYLAHTLEMEGSLRDAESHYVEASEWQSAINMYRSNEMWDECIRVAKTHGGIQATKRMTLALLISLGVPEGSKYLIKHNLIEASLDHAAETGAFDIAFEVANLHMPYKVSEIHLKYALYLEDSEKYNDAEKEFIAAEKPREAIEMYMHIEEWDNALRVAENYDPPSIMDIHIQQGKLLIETKKFKEAEDHFLIASRPELVLDMYKDHHMLQDALRITQSHLPHLLPEITALVQSGQFKNSGNTGNNSGNNNGMNLNNNNNNKQFIQQKSDIIQIGKSYEQQKKWNEAIELYLTNTEYDITLYERAIELARSNVPNRAVDIVIEVSKKLINMKKEEHAANILFEIGRFDDAINVCLQAKKYEKAKSLASGNPTLLRKVNEAYHNYLELKQDASELIETGRVDIALDVLANKGEWEKLWEIINRESVSSTVVGKYVVQRVNELIVSDTAIDQIDDAIRLLHKRPFPPNDNLILIFKKVTKLILSRQLEDEGPNYINILKLLREILYRITMQYRSDRPDSDTIKNDLYELLMSSHYSYMLHLCMSLGLKEIATKCAITLLKFPFIIVQDKLYYQAGIMCRDLKNINFAFMLLNRYVDIAECIDAGNTSYLDDGEFHIADAIPLNGPLPSQHYIRTEDTREDIRTWILSVVTDSNVEQKFPSREQSKGTLYEGLFHTNRKSCIVTGYPVHPADTLDINNSTANRRDWNAVVSKTKLCPWTSQPQNTIY